MCFTFSMACLPLPVCVTLGIRCGPDILVSFLSFGSIPTKIIPISGVCVWFSDFVDGIRPTSTYPGTGPCTLLFRLWPGLMVLVLAGFTLTTTLVRFVLPVDSVLRATVKWTQPFNDSELERRANSRPVPSCPHFDGEKGPTLSL